MHQACFEKNKIKFRKTMKSCLVK